MLAPAFFAYINAAVTEVISRCCGVIVLSFFLSFFSYFLLEGSDLCLWQVDMMR